MASTSSGGLRKTSKSTTKVFTVIWRVSRTDGKNSTPPPWSFWPSLVQLNNHKQAAQVWWNECAMQKSYTTNKPNYNNSKLKALFKSFDNNQNGLVNQNQAMESSSQATLQAHSLHRPPFPIPCLKHWVLRPQKNVAWTQSPIQSMAMILVHDFRSWWRSTKLVSSRTTFWRRCTIWNARKRT